MNHTNIHTCMHLYIYCFLFLNSWTLLTQHCVSVSVTMSDVTTFSTVHTQESWYNVRHRLRRLIACILDDAPVGTTLCNGEVVKRHIITSFEQIAEDHPKLYKLISDVEVLKKDHLKKSRLLDELDQIGLLAKRARMTISETSSGSGRALAEGRQSRSSMVTQNVATLAALVTQQMKASRRSKI